MEEIELLNIIKDISQNDYIGDDCAYLKELGIVVTQDNLVENVHFKTEWATPYQIGYKAVAVNISDILASGAKPEYLTVGLSIPQKYSNKDFISNLYNGMKDASCNAKIIGGDITASDKIFISVTALGSTVGRNVSSRKNAQSGQLVVVSGDFGSSSLGYSALLNNFDNKIYNDVIKEHLTPILKPKFSEEIAINIDEDYAMMDTSDGLADALFKIADLSNVTLEIDYDKIPHNKLVTSYSDIVFGGEDYNLIATIPEKFLKYLSEYYVVGVVKQRENNIRFKIDNNKYCSYKDLTIFRHFN